MNLREGLRRIFLLTGVAVALLAAVYMLKGFPTRQQHYGFWTTSFKTSAEFDSRAPDGTAVTIAWPTDQSDEFFIKAACQAPPTTETKKTCELFKSDDGTLRSRQWEAAASVFLSAVGAFFLVYLLWRLLDWVLAGFMQASGPRQNA